MRVPTAPLDVILADLAGRQHGVVSRRQLVAIGFDRGAIERRLANRRLHQVYRGVYAVGHAIVDWRGRYLAAVLACGDEAVLSHRSAAALWGIRPTGAPRIDVTVSRTSGVRSTSAIVVHRPQLAAPVVVRDGVPVTTPGRTLLDLATALRKRQLEKAAEMAEALRLDVVVDDTQPGARRLRAAMAHDLGHTTRSGLEDDFLALCDRFEIPRPRVNATVEGVEVDFCWPDERLIVETDGRHHITRAGVRARPRARRVAARPRLARDALHDPAGAPRRRERRGARAQRA